MAAGANPEAARTGKSLPQLISLARKWTAERGRFACARGGRLATRLRSFVDRCVTGLFDFQVGRLGSR